MASTDRSPEELLQTLRYSYLALDSEERRKRSSELWLEFAEALDARNAEVTGKLARRLIEESGKAARVQLSADTDEEED